MFPLWGNGSGAFLRELTSELAKRGHTIAIVAPDKRKLPGIKHYVVAPPQIGVFVGHPELPNAKKFEEMSGKELGEIYLSYLKTTVGAVADFNPEIIHVFHTAFLPGIARIIKILFGIKFIITTHGSDLNYLSKDRRFMGLIADANRVARFITANSEFTKKWYLDMFGHNLKQKSTVIMGGVNVDNYKEDPEEIKLINQKYNLAGKKVVLFTGRLTKNKGVIYLIKAASYIKGTILIIGDGPERSNLENEIKDRKLSNVIMAGYINPNDERLFHAFYERADIHVSPSIWEEPFGLSIIESMAAPQSAVVATKKGGVSSIIKDGYNGLLIPARNSKALAEAVNRLLEDELLRKKIGENGYKTVIEKFTWEKIADQFEAIYKKFSYSTAEYLARVRGVNPDLSNFIRSLNNFSTRV
ncbi:MAG: glycosyltransferase family 4 protein [Candidatus Levybacteria bacterium]|nr:glycosyltransferase family 4 protein [Candidatus Levybacteria bacterium]MBI2622945.1 glycosyltransferase family 4 protein [Candidatus Levybacteria bacterium]